RPPVPSLFPYTTLFRSSVRLTVGSEALTEYARGLAGVPADIEVDVDEGGVELKGSVELFGGTIHAAVVGRFEADGDSGLVFLPRSEEHTSELQSRENLV